MVAARLWFFFGIVVRETAFTYSLEGGLVLRAVGVSGFFCFKISG